MWHCDFPLTQSCISISSPIVVSTVAGANESICSFLTAFSVVKAVLYLKLYKWCKTKNRSHSASGCSREHVSPCFDYKGSQWNKHKRGCTKVNILHMIGGYLNGTMNRNTWKREPEIGTHGPSQTWENPQVDRYGYEFGLGRSCGYDFWTDLEPSWTILLEQTRTAGGLPGPIPNTSFWW